MGILLWPDGPSWAHAKSTAVIAMFFIDMPLCLVEKIESLRFVTPVSVCCSLYIIVVMAVNLPSQLAQHMGHGGYGDIVWMSFDLRIFPSFAMFLFAFNCHINVVPVATNLIRPTKVRIRKVSLSTNCMQMFLYVFMACVGYLSFLGKTPQDILYAYNCTDVWILLGRIGFSFVMLVVMPLNMHPTVRHGMHILEMGASQPLVCPSPASSPIASRECSPSASPRTQLSEPFMTNFLEDVVMLQAGDGGDSSPNTNSPTTSSPQHIQEPKKVNPFPRIVFTMVVLCAELGLALTAPGVAVVIGLLGGSISTVMMLFIPAYGIGILLEPSFSNKCKQCVLYVFGVLGFFSVPLKIYDLCVGHT